MRKVHNQWIEPRAVLDGKYFRYGVLIERIGPKAVDCFGREGNYPASAQFRHSIAERSRIGSGNNLSHRSKKSGKCQG
jgi:hypothetical protein